MREINLAIGTMLLWAAAAQAAECPNPDAIGTSRTIVVDPTEHPQIGSMQYAESLPLQDHEVVLTFDDGPLPPHTTRVLETLASECVKATFFLVGRMAHTFPNTVRQIHEAGHTIGTHSESHPLKFHKMSVDRAAQEINQGIASVTAALGEPPAPFFRIPGLLRADGVEHYLASEHLMVWSIDFPADDWLRISSAEVLRRALQRIEAHHRGVLLLHDIHERTVEALPVLLKELKRRGYHIVHVVPATANQPKTPTEPSEWLRRGHHLWPEAVSYPEVGPELPAPNPDDFGFAEIPVALPQSGAPRRVHIAARGEITLPAASPWLQSPEEGHQFSAAFKGAQLSAPSRDSFSYSEEAPTPWLAPKTTASLGTPKKSFDVVPDVTLPPAEIPRLLMAREHLETTSDEPGALGAPPSSAPERVVAPMVHAPLVLTKMPHAAFP